MARGLSARATLQDARAFMAALGGDAKVMIKAVAGGGGRGMRVVESAGALEEAYESARSEAKAAFGIDDVYLEELVSPARHVEVQVIGDADGQVAHLYERECSLQRRQQKLVEFAPSPAIGSSLREALTGAALKLARASGCHTLCTFEFLVDAQGRFFFMEANPRLQVEHTVTEEVMGVDLVQTQFRLAGGARLQELGLTQADIDGRRAASRSSLRINMESVDAQGRSVPSGGTFAHVRSTRRRWHPAWTPLQRAGTRRP